MRITIEGVAEVDATPDNANFFRYPNDMMDGLFVDMDADYIFVPKLIRGGYHAMEIMGLQAGIPVVEWEIPDLSEPPHCWVMKAMGRCMIGQIEEHLQ